MAKLKIKGMDSKGFEVSHFEDLTLTAETQANKLKDKGFEPNLYHLYDAKPADGIVKGCTCYRNAETGEYVPTKKVRL
jgi:maleate cis-trans isomerase